MDAPDVTGTEAVVFGTDRVDDVRSTLDAYARAVLGSPLADVLFRAGRVDAVWAVRLADGREVVITAHRQPVDLEARLATVEAQRILVREGFPCPVPVAETTTFRDLALTAESLVTAGTQGDARDPAVRLALARGLADHVRILRGIGLAERAGLGPAWCRYQDGPWPVPHDAIFDFGATPPGYEWLDEFAGLAAERLRRGASLERVVGHADWYAGNARFDGSRLVGTFDWDLVAAPEAHLAGFAAATFTDGGTAVQDLPAPDDVRAFLRDYDGCRILPASSDEQVQSAAAAAWALAYNARCQLAFVEGAPPAGSALGLLRAHGEDYLGVRW